MSYIQVSSVVILILCNVSGVFLTDASGLKHCICIGEAAPVCGSDHKIYANDCLLDCTNMIMKTNIEIVKDELCKEEYCQCDLRFNPVCASDNETYTNICIFRCAKASEPSLNVLHEGQCVKKKKANSTITESGAIGKLKPQKIMFKLLKKLN